LAGLERIELPPSVSKTEMISISPKTDIWMRVQDLNLGCSELMRLEWWPPYPL
jgi:hypothetical protein